MSKSQRLLKKISSSMCFQIFNQTRIRRRNQHDHHFRFFFENFENDFFRDWAKMWTTWRCTSKFVWSMTNKRRKNFAMLTNIVCVLLEWTTCFLFHRRMKINTKIVFARNSFCVQFEIFFSTKRKYSIKSMIWLKNLRDIVTHCQRLIWFWFRTNIYWFFDFDALFTSKKNFLMRKHRWSTFVCKWCKQRKQNQKLIASKTQVNKTTKSSKKNDEFTNETLYSRQKKFKHQTNCYWFSKNHEKNQSLSIR